MALSNSTNFTLTRDELINMALRKLQVIDPMQSTDPTTLTDCGREINAMLQAWQADGVDIWLYQELVLYMALNAQKYAIGPSGDECAVLSDSVITTLSESLAASGTSATVDSITGIAESDKVGIVLDDGTIHWTTANGAPSGSTVTLTAGPASAASSGNYIFAFTSLPTRPIEITEARTRNTNGIDDPVEIITDRTEFLSIDDKTSQGETLKVYYDPQTVNGQLYVWPVCGTANATDRLILSVKRRMQDLDAGINNFDMPDEALMAVVYGLAENLQPNYGKGDMRISQMAAYYYSLVKKRYTTRRDFHFTPR